MTATAPVFNRKMAWVVTIIQVLSSVTFGLGMYQGMTTTILKIVYFNMDYTTFGLVSVFGLISIISGIPGGLLMGKFGARKLFLGCMLLSVIAGTVPLIYLIIMGRAANFIVFTAIGCYGGLAWGCVSVAGTMLVNMWFPPQKRSLPMGCCGMFVPLSLMIILFASSWLISLAPMDGFTPEEIAACFGQSPAGWIPVMLFGYFFTILMTVLAFLFLRMPKPEESWLGVNAATEGTEAGTSQNFNEGRARDGFTNLGVWLLVLVFVCYSWASGAFATYWPTYIESPAELGGFSVPPADANMMSTAVSYAMIAVSLIVGWLLTKINRGKWWILLAVVIAMIAFNDWFLFRMPSTAFFVPFLITYGCTQELYPCITYTLMPEFCDSPKELSTALGLLSCVMNIAGSVSGMINGRLRDVFGNWSALTIPLSICAIGAIVLGIALIIVWRKRWSTLQARAAEQIAKDEAEKEATPATA